MSYEKMMRWQKTHRKGIPNLYLGFDTGTDIVEPQITHEQRRTLEIESFQELLRRSDSFQFPIHIARSPHEAFLSATEYKSYTDLKANNPEAYGQVYAESIFLSLGVFGSDERTAFDSKNKAVVYIQNCIKQGGK